MLPAPTSPSSDILSVIRTQRRLASAPPAVRGFARRFLQFQAAIPDEYSAFGPEFLMTLREHCIAEWAESQLWPTLQETESVLAGLAAAILTGMNPDPIVSSPASGTTTEGEGWRQKKRNQQRREGGVWSLFRSIIPCDHCCCECSILGRSYFIFFVYCSFTLPDEGFLLHPSPSDDVLGCLG